MSGCCQLRNELRLDSQVAKSGNPHKETSMLWAPVRTKGIYHLFWARRHHRIVIKHLDVLWADHVSDICRTAIVRLQGNTIYYQRMRHWEALIATRKRLVSPETTGIIIFRIRIKVRRQQNTNVNWASPHAVLISQDRNRVPDDLFDIVIPVGRSPG